MRWLLMIIIVTPLLVVGEDWDAAYVDSLFSGRRVDDIEGVWQLPREGAKMAIKRTRSDHYEIYLLDSPRLSIPPGTLIGTAVGTHKPGYYDGELQSVRLGKKDKLTSQTVTFTVDDDMMSIKPYKTGYSISFKRLIYRLFKISIVENKGRPSDLDGAKKVLPKSETGRLPVYL